MKKFLTILLMSLVLVACGTVDSNEAGLRISHSGKINKVYTSPEFILSPFGTSYMFPTTEQVFNYAAEVVLTSTEGDNQIVTTDVELAVYYQIKGDEESIRTMYEQHSDFFLKGLGNDYTTTEVVALEEAMLNSMNQAVRPVFQGKTVVTAGAFPCSPNSTECESVDYRSRISDELETKIAERLEGRFPYITITSVDVSEINPNASWLAEISRRAEAQEKLKTDRDTIDGNIQNEVKARELIAQKLETAREQQKLDAALAEGNFEAYEVFGGDATTVRLAVEQTEQMRLFSDAIKNADHPMTLIFGDGTPFNINPAGD